MNRERFMKELEYLLQDIPEEEKADALAYYADYPEIWKMEGALPTGGMKTNVFGIPITAWRPEWIFRSREKGRKRKAGKRIQKRQVISPGKGNSRLSKSKRRRRMDGRLPAWCC